MGYDMQQTGCRFRIPAARQAEALQAVKALFKSFYHQKYAWVDTAKALRAQTLAAMLAEWGWRADEAPQSEVPPDNGDIVGIHFESEKAGDEDALFAALAPYVTAGSFIEMSGEEGEWWRWLFDGKSVRRVEPIVTWPDTNST